MLKTIFAVSGKPGLYKKISQSKNLLIFESLTDKKRIPAYVGDKIFSLGETQIYTTGGQAPLYEVLNRIKEKENLQKITIDFSKATPDELRAYLTEVFPEFDRERVYPTDIKRLMNWYNQLLDLGITEFDPEEKVEEKTETEDIDPEEEAKKPKEEIKKVITPSKATTRNTATGAKNTSLSVKQHPASTKMRQRTKSK
jgi:hypothetical protein